MNHFCQVRTWQFTYVKNILSADLSEKWYYTAEEGPKDPNWTGCFDQWRIHFPKTEAVKKANRFLNLFIKYSEIQWFKCLKPLEIFCVMDVISHFVICDLKKCFLDH